MYKQFYVFGIPCFTDAYICDEDFIYFISFFERQAITKAVAAAIVGGRTIELDGMKIRRLYGDEMKVLTQKLQKGIVHKIIYDDTYFKGGYHKIVIGKDYEAAYDFIDSTTTTPLKPEWKKWLWENALEVKKLVGFGSINDLPLDEVYLLRLKDTNLDNLVLEGLKSGQIE